MPGISRTPMTRERATGEILRALLKEREKSAPDRDPELERFLICPELQRASALLATAVGALGARGQTAFTATTHTPLPAPPGWLPPPI